MNVHIKEQKEGSDWISNISFYKYLCISVCISSLLGARTKDMLDYEIERYSLCILFADFEGESNKTKKVFHCFLTCICWQIEFSGYSLFFNQIVYAYISIDILPKLKFKII